MQIKINGKQFDIPTDLSQITLGQFLHYWDKYGRDLDRQLQEVLAADYQDEFEQSLAAMEIEIKEAIGWYTSLTGYDFGTLRGIEVDVLLKHYRQVRALLVASEQEQAVNFPFINQWQDATWVVADWRVTPDSDLIFNELLTSKEITRQIYSLGKGKWDAMPYLCAVFFRKEGEAFTEALVAEGSERVALMKDLPMSCAIQVAFFLTVSVGICSRILASSVGAATATPT